MKNKRVLVTGASGFIGKHLCKKLYEMGAYVYGTQHETPVITEYVNEVVNCDLNSDSDVMEAVLHSDPEYVFHLASQAIVGIGEADPHFTIQTNIMGSWNLFNNLSRARNGNLRALIVASTDKVYGRHDKLPYTEEHALLGTQQVYETSKLCEDALAQMTGHAFQLPVGITRFGNVYGPGDFHWNRLIPETIKACYENNELLVRSSGQFYRDFVYIDDVVDGYIRLAKFVALGARPELEKEPTIINFGTEVPSRVLDVVGMIYDEFHKPFPKILHHSFHGAQHEIHEQYVSYAKANHILGWFPNTRLKTGISETVKWYKDYFNGQ